MSSMLDAPPPQIQIGGGGPPDDGGGGPEGPIADALPDDSTPPGGDNGSPVTSLLRQALLNVHKAARMNPDDQEAALISEVAAKIAKLIALEQSDNDSLSGAGPGVKALRRASIGGGPGGGGGGPGGL